MRILFACLLASAAALHAETPFNFNTTPGKLPKSIVPVEYAVTVAPDVEKLTNAGSVDIKLDVREPSHQIVLNAAELEITAASLDGQQLPASAVQSDPKQETVTIALESELPKGAHTLGLKFNGRINERGQGLYFARYQEEGTGAKKTMLGTQFEPSDARRFFPCWDEPSFRARFQLTAVVPENWMAVSNMPVEGERKVDGRKEVRFGMTPPMASYLNVFVAGELDMIEGQAGPTKLRIIATKGKAAMGRYALESTAQILNYYNDYFGVAYPLPKLDQIAIPGGFGGAMENWGGITYYESALLFDPKNSSAETKQNIYAVIAHEVAHQWFGDLVTMAWWDNLWLNEGFASWMGSKCTAKFNPQWEVWLRTQTPRDPSRRVGIPKETAMQGDARSTTHPIQQTINTEAEANSAFDDITYKKGQSFLRMLESFLGEDTFRKGIRSYMAAHKYSNSTTADLWKALGDASGKPVGAIAAGWTQQPGFPVVKVKRAEDGKVTLTQERFTVHWPDPQPLQWQIPLTYSVVGNPKPVSLLMTAPEMELPGIPAKRAVKLNVAGAGNYRCEYDAAAWKQVVEQVPRFSAPDRVNLLSDTWALVEANRAPLAQYLDLVRRLGPTTVLAESEQIINVFDFLNRLLAGDPRREEFQKYARSILRPAFDQIGWEPKNAEPASAISLRASLVRSLGDLNDAGVIAGCRERFAKFLANPASVSPDLRPAVLAVTGRYADEATWTKLHDLGVRTTSIEQKGVLYDALSSAIDPALAGKTLQISLTDELPSSRAVFLVAKVARQSERPDIAWEFARAHLKELTGKLDALGSNSYVPALFTFFSDNARVAELTQFAQTNLPPSAAKEVAKAVDELGFRADLKARLLPEIPGAFTTPPAKAH